MVGSENLPGARFSEAQIWDWLTEVPDPELPFVSVVDLGIVRSVRTTDDETQVVVTPTYSGCPATAVITLAIEQKLAEKGLQNCWVTQKISPPWTTDWISDDGRAKLKANGIAPPSGQASCAGMMAKAPVRCPRCNSANTSRMSFFGSTPCKASYRCDDCLEPFDYFKPF